MTIDSYGFYSLGNNYRNSFNKKEDFQSSLKEKTAEEKDSENSSKDATVSKEKLSTSEQQQVSKLQARDSEVRAHEAAHKAAGGALAGSASFSYQKGPDGKMYAIGGEVPISFKEGSTPQETIANARQVIAAAMAPANPSPQDYAVASSARMLELSAQQELVKELQEKQSQKDGLKTYQQEAKAA